MASFWKEFIDNLFGSSESNEEKKSSASKLILNTTTGYPNTFKPNESDITFTQSTRVFEPALLQYRNAFRIGDPEFKNIEDAEKWYTARQQIINHLLQIISNTKWKEYLVLRGSLLLKTWFGNAARQPGDIDWVITPKDVEIDGTLSKELFQDLLKKVAENPRIENAFIAINEIAVDDIWTYERVPGRRIVFPWSIEKLPRGSVQMDFVFGEDLCDEIIRQNIFISETTNTEVLAASQKLSLAWKLLWLETDIHPQGKDLYDAVLLAEQTHLPLSLLKKVLLTNEWHRIDDLKPNFPLDWEVDWGNFKLEYSWVGGDAKQWQERLTKALEPTFNSRN